VLTYTPPQNVFRQTIDPAEDYSFNGANASVQVYQFPSIPGKYPAGVPGHAAA
jgi:hypothetical protein